MATGRSSRQVKALAERVALRPIETVLSGPAASLVGASWLCGRSDFIMSDMGGTTTDLGVLANGRPQVAEQGAEVGGWRTMVKAIDVKTIGLGGDSEIAIGLNGVITVGPQRVAPISLLGSRYPEVVAMLEADLADTEGGSMHGKFVLKPFGANDALTAEVNAKEAELLAMVGDERHPSFPDTPTLAEQGFPNITPTTFYGIYGPAGVSRDIVDKVNAKVAEIMKDPEMIHRSLERGVLLRPMDGPATGRALAAQTEINRELVKVAGLKME